MERLRLDKYLADMGKGTRSQIKALIRKGEVQVNGQRVKSPELKLDPERDQVCLFGEKVDYAFLEYYMLNKPQGVVSATEDGRDQTAVELIRVKKRKDLFPVGRLDKDTEGLLLITNDGALAHELLSPKKHVDKTYLVRLRDPLLEEDRQALEKGVDIREEKPTLPAKAKILPGDGRELLLTIREGRFHQIKRMLQAVGNQVVFLKRLSMGSLELDESLRPGEYRPLTQEEIARLKEHAGTDKSGDL